MRGPLADRIRWRLHHHFRAIVLRTLGRPVYCTNCGRELFRVLPLIHRGRLEVIGAEEPNVRVAFQERERLGFSHLDLDQCPSAERPWVS
jgi:hypothetical protein